MSIVNFSIPKTLERRVEKAIKEKGFLSKAEFFRVAAFYFLEHGVATVDENVRTTFLTEAIKKEVLEKYADTKTPSVRKQLSDV